ncbi:hypothetical protein MLD38_012974 [Melastoma candidum]|uniref:Uncharacterized protein n=1 Tax=Melastoma candidum TaxID=119954 RepID=A0ACB9R7H9_9MYRT|nr:hypothetical protein MLD38_012974 [Melastoma candidum]
MLPLLPGLDTSPPLPGLDNVPLSCSLQCSGNSSYPRKLGSLVETGGLNDIVETLQTADVRLYGGSRASSVPNIPQTLLFHHEYNSVACAIKIVDDVEGAIGHIHRHGSAHTEYNC